MKIPKKTHNDEIMQLILILLSLCNIPSGAFYPSSFRLPISQYQNRMKDCAFSKPSHGDKTESHASLVNQSFPLSLAEAMELKRRAEEIMSEARELEAALVDSRLRKQLELDKGRDAIIENLFSNSTILVKKLRDENWSPEKILPIVERLYQRLRFSMGKSSSRDVSSAIQNHANKVDLEEEERDRLTYYLADLLKASQVLDNETSMGENKNLMWKGKVATLIESKLRELHNKADFGTTSTVAEPFSEEILLSSEHSNKPYLEIPRWMPSIFTFYLKDLKNNLTFTLDPKDISVIRDDVLSGSKFFCSSVQYNAVACRFVGSLRKVSYPVPTNYTSLAWMEIENRLQNCGLSDRIQLFWIRGKNNFLTGNDISVLAIPKCAFQLDRKHYSTSSWMACLITLSTIVSHAISCFALNSQFFHSVLSQPDENVRELMACSPIIFGMIWLQILNEVLRRVVAKRHQIKLGLPVSLPSPELGSFGNAVPFRSFPPNKNAFFDVSMSAPLCGMLTSVTCIIAGLMRTLRSSSDALSSYPVVPAVLFKSSFLAASILNFMAPKLLVLPAAQPIPVHTAVCVGFFGLLTSAINLMPIMGLDGGNAYTSIMGRKRAFTVSSICVLSMALSYFQGNDASIFPSLIFVLALSRLGKKPVLVRNDIEAADDNRLKIYIGALALAFMSVLPFPGGQGFI
jgi:hypothetical protein